MRARRPPIDRRTPLEELPACLSVPQAAEWLGVSKQHLYDEARAGRFPLAELGHRRLVLRDTLRSLWPAPDSLPTAGR